MGHGFTEEDEKKYITALNYIAKEAKFANVDSVAGSIELYKHFSFLQALSQKINSHILEVKSIHVPEPKKKGKGKKNGKVTDLVEVADQQALNYVNAITALIDSAPGSTNADSLREIRELIAGYHALDI